MTSFRFPKNVFIGLGLGLELELGLELRLGLELELAEIHKYFSVKRPFGQEY